MADEHIETGWYTIDASWHLYIGDNPSLESVPVDTIHISERGEDDDTTHERANYTVEHYRPDGSHITTIHVTASDIGTVLGQRRPVSPPDYAHRHER